MRVISNKDAVKRELKSRLEIAGEIIGGMIESAAKDRCPVDTGLLRNSITHGVTGGRLSTTSYSDSKGHTGSYGDGTVPADGSWKITVVVGTNVYYAPYVELGHRQEPGRYVPALGKRLKASHVAAKPFLGPAAEGMKETAKQVLEQILKNNPSGGSQNSQGDSGGRNKKRDEGDAAQK